MAISIVRLGRPRRKNEGLRLGTVRRPPRGMPRADYARRDIYDVWFPNLAPSEALLKASFPADEKTWKKFRRSFLAEMKGPGPRHDLALLAALSHQLNFSIGCYCEQETLCHRSVLRELFLKLGADVKT